MWVIVHCNEGMDQGLVCLCRELGDDELMDERAFADQVAEQFCAVIAKPDGYIPNCCGDLRVEFLEGTKRPHGTRNGEPDSAGGYALKSRQL